MAAPGSTAPTDRHAPRPVRTARSFHGRDRWGANPTEAQDRAHLVRVVASHPHYLGWLQDRLGHVLDREAARLAQLGQHAAAAELHQRARAYRAGECDAL